MPLSNSLAHATAAHLTPPAPEGSEAARTGATVSGIACSDDGLVARMAQCDATALAEFYDRHASLLYSLAMRILQDSRAAELAVQEAMATIWERAPDHAPALGSAIGWAVAITRSAAIAHRRPAAPGHALAGPAPCPTDLAANPAGGKADPARGHGAATRVREALDDLHREQREAIEMTFFGGLNQTELAVRLGVPLNKARTLLRHALMTLRDAMEGQI